MILNSISKVIIIIKSIIVKKYLFRATYLRQAKKTDTRKQYLGNFKTSADICMRVKTCN